MATKFSLNILWCLFMKGSLIWRAQRYSSLIIFTYFIYVAYFIFSSDIMSFDIWTNFALSAQLKIATSLIFMLLLLHAFIGLWTVGTDYLTTRTLGFLNRSLGRKAKLLRSLYYLLFALMGLLYTAVIIYTLWL